MNCDFCDVMNKRKDRRVDLQRSDSDEFSSEGLGMMAHIVAKWIYDGLVKRATPPVKNKAMSGASNSIESQ